MEIEYSDEEKVLVRATGGESCFVIPETVERIESLAFDGCEELSTVVIPASVNYIGANVFNGCKNLTDVFCNIEDLDALQYSGDSFDGCSMEHCSLHVPACVKDAYEEHPLFSQCKDIDDNDYNSLLEKFAVSEFIKKADEAFYNGVFWDAAVKYFVAADTYPAIGYYCNYRLGWISELDGKYDAALKSYDEGIAANPEYAYLHLMKGKLLKRHFGKEKEAVACFLKCLELEEGKIGEGICWHHACAELGMRDKAIEAMNSILAECPDDSAMYFDAACLYCTLQEYDLALDYLGTCLGMGYNIKHVQFDTDIECLRTFEKYNKIIEYNQSLSSDDAPYKNMSIRESEN